MPNFLPSIFNKDSLFRIPSVLQELQFLQNEDEGKGVSIYEENNNIIVEAPLPGLNIEDIDARVANGVLWIKGAKTEEESDKNKKFYRKSERSFSYSVPVPEQIDNAQEVDASYKDGILKIILPKAKSAQAKRINIKGDKKK